MEAVIREGTLRLHSSEASCDVILSCQGQRLMAHRLILSIASPVLKDLLIQDTTEPSVVIFPDINSNTMSQILDYIYTGTVIIYSKTINDFINAANLLQLPIDLEYLEKFQLKKMEKREIFSRKTQKKIPNLLPIAKARKLCNYVIPSPWCPRVAPVLEDPRRDFAVADNLNQMLSPPVREKPENDPNNNTQTFRNVLEQSIELDLTYLPQKLDEEIDGKKQKPFKCEDCGKCFSQLRNYKYHRSIHEGTKEFAAKCPECGKIFNDRGYLSSHMKIHRDRKEYACPHCPKRFNQRVAYNMHLRIHTGIKPHECPTCGKSFSRKMLLKQHQRVHTGERPYSCPECGKTFADRSNMSLHARLHTGVKPYSCNLCPKSFTKKHHLKTHMNFHTGLKPYTCQKCGLAFSQSSNMRTHYKKCILKNCVEKDNAESNSST